MAPVSCETMMVEGELRTAPHSREIGTPRLGLLAVAGLAALLGACASSGGRPAAAVASAPAPRDGSTEVYRARSLRQRSQALLKLPGAASPRMVAFDVVDGMAVVEGDILLGPASQVPLRYGPQLFGGGQSGASGGFHAVTINDMSHLWPGGSIPYEIDGTVSQATIGSIQWAIAEAGTTAIKLRPRLPTDKDYVVFSDTGDGCTSYVGRVGGPQTISVTGCGRGSVLHEVLHAAGFYHEQSRNDRDQYITIVWSEIEPSQQSAFETRPNVSQDVGAYDYGSIMHYGATAFSRTGRPTIIPKQPGVTIGQREGLSTSDRAAIASLYGAGGGSPFPTQPPGTPAPPPATAQPSWWPFPVDGSAAIPGLPSIPGLPALVGLPETFPMPEMPALPEIPATLPQLPLPSP